MFAASRLRILQGLMILIGAGSLVACHKEAPPKPKAVVVKTSPEELKRLSDSANKSLEGLKPLLGALNEKFAALHQQFDVLPGDLPDYEETRGKFYSADEGLGRMNAKVSWLTGQIEAAVKASDGPELEEISKSIARSYEEIPRVEQIAMELLHEVLPFTRMAERLQANKQAMCEAVKATPPTAAMAAAMAKKASTH